MTPFQKEQIARIFNISESLERGEENVVEAAQDIQRAIFNLIVENETFAPSHTVNQYILDKLNAPYPFCRKPSECSKTHRCMSNPVCND